MLTPEGRVKAEVRKYLKSIGTYQFWPVQIGMGARTVDCLCSLRGQFTGIECKSPGQVPTGHQEMTLAMIAKSFGIAIWGDSAEQIIERIKQVLGAE